MRFNVSGKVESTALFGGGVYRAAAAACSFSISLKARLPHESVGSYLTMMRGLAQTRTTVTIEGTAYPDLVLTSGRVTSEEGAQYAVCEMELTEVDN